MHTFTYHQVLSAILPFFFGWHDDFSIYLVDTCFEYWETIMDCKRNAAARTLSPISIVDIFELESLRAKSTNIFRTLWTYYILAQEGANKHKYNIKL